VRGLTQDADGVTVQVQGPEGSSSLRAGYVVGCDGAHSLVREQAGVGYLRLPESVTWHPTGELELPDGTRVPGGMRSVTPTGRGAYSLVSMIPGVLIVAVSEEPDGPVDLDAPMTLEELQAGLRRVLGRELPLGEPIWLSRTVPQARLAERYRAGRVLLAGDAAHLFPAGGAALNVGLTDAVNLGWKLAAQVQGWAPPGLLDSYGTERRGAAERTLLHTRAQAALAAFGEDAAALRKLFGELMGYPEPLRHVGELLSGADIRYDMGTGGGAHPLAGHLAPDLPLQGEGAPGRVAELLRQPRGVLLDLVGGTGLEMTAAGWKDRVEVLTAWSEREPLPAAALLIRPDGYVAWATSADRPEPEVKQELQEALRRWFGEPG
jgi:FAD binding domain